MTQPNPILQSTMGGVAIGDWSDPETRPLSDGSFVFDVAQTPPIFIDSTGVVAGQSLFFDNASNRWKPGNVLISLTNANQFTPGNDGWTPIAITPHSVTSSVSSLIITDSSGHQRVEVDQFGRLYIHDDFGNDRDDNRAGVSIFTKWHAISAQHSYDNSAFTNGGNDLIDGTHRSNGDAVFLTHLGGNVPAHTFTADADGTSTLSYVSDLAGLIYTGFGANGNSQGALVRTPANGTLNVQSVDTVNGKVTLSGPVTAGANLTFNVDHPADAGTGGNTCLNLIVPYSLDHPAGSAAQSTAMTWQGRWAVGTTYALNDGVRGTNGKAYVSKAGGNIGNDPVADVTHTFWNDAIDSVRNNRTLQTPILIQVQPVATGSPAVNLSYQSNQQAIKITNQFTAGGTTPANGNAVGLFVNNFSTGNGIGITNNIVPTGNSAALAITDAAGVGNAAIRVNDSTGNAGFTMLSDGTFNAGLRASSTTPRVKISDAVAGVSETLRLFNTGASGVNAIGDAASITFADGTNGVGQVAAIQGVAESLAPAYGALRFLVHNGAGGNQEVLRITANGGGGGSKAIGFFSKVTAPAVQYTAAAVTANYTPGVSTAVTIDGTFKGTTGATAYTIGDIVTALKAYGLIVQ